MRFDTLKNFGLALFSASAILTYGCGGGKVVVVPGVASPAPSALTTPASPVVVTAIPQVPAPPEDAIAGSRPASDYVWVKGYYNWTGDRYVWVPGEWARVPRPAATWVPGHWEATAGGYIWIAGRWQ